MACFTKVALPCFRRAVQSALWVIFGEKGMAESAEWQAMHKPSNTFLPSALPAATGAAAASAPEASDAAASAAPTAGASKLPPDWLVIYTMARLSSSSVKSAAPPLAGMALKPLRAWLNKVSKPCAMRGAHSPLWVTLGELGTTLSAAWHWIQILLKICSPVRWPTGVPSPMVTLPTGIMRVSVADWVLCSTSL